MEKKINDILGNLNLEETNKLLKDIDQTKIDKKSKNKIRLLTLEKAGKKQKRVSIKLVASLAAVIVLVLALSIVGFGHMKGIFTFIPSIGIKENDSKTIYAKEDIVSRIKEGNLQADLISAVYTDNYLSITVSVLGQALWQSSFTIYENGKEVIFKNNNNPYSLSVSSDSSMLNYSYERKVPKEDDLFEIQIEGFIERLSFKLKACDSYEDLEEIGPTDIHNNIAITTVSQRIDNQIVVWTYPYILEGYKKDSIIGFGEGVNTAFVLSKYLLTESGTKYASTKGWQIRGRNVYDVEETDKDFTLHIPFLSILREEPLKLIIDIPKTDGYLESSKVLTTSLGKIKVIGVKRTENNIKIYFDLTSNDDKQRLYSFNYKDVSSARHYKEETGVLDFIDLYVKDKQSKLTLEISDLYYFLFGEYEIPLDVK